jgi:hypothetical protein
MLVLFPGVDSLHDLGKFLVALFIQAELLETVNRELLNPRKLIQLSDLLHFYFNPIPIKRIVQFLDRKATRLIHIEVFKNTLYFSFSPQFDRFAEVSLVSS